MYVEMTIEEALELNKGDKNSKVLVAISNLEDDEVVAFVKKTRYECENIIKQAETIAHSCDEFMDSLMCYTEKQDIRRIAPIGKMSTILMRGKIKY